jgi:hypothetical protein
LFILAFQREVHRRGYRDAPDVGEGRPKIECIGVVQFITQKISDFHNRELYDKKKETVKNNNLAVICDKMAINQLLE